MPAPVYIDSHYARTLSVDAPRRALSGTVETEICVIGGGMAGLATALGLAERGHKVVVLEAERVGWGASGRNGGMVGAGFSLGLSAIERKVGRAHAKRLYQLSADCIPLMRERIETYGIDCGPIVPGVYTAWWYDAPDEVRRHIDKMNEMDATNIDFVPRQDLRELYRTERYYDGVYKEDGFHFHALNFTIGTAAAAESRGAIVYEGSRVTSLELAGDIKRVRTAAGEVRADQVVFCCSGYLGWLHPRLALATLPVATYVVLTEPLGDRLADAVRTEHGISDTRLANDYYRALPDTRLFWGGRISAVRRPANLEAKMISDILRIYPQLQGIKAEVAWPGTMGYSVHKMPQIGQLSPGVWYNQGYGGHGMNTTTMGGELIAKAIAAQDEEWRLFEPFGLPFAGGPVGPYVAQMVYWKYKLGDWWQARR
ncbi:MAG: FAD-binding oxidoreductase [Rhodospirillaceae bacterium]|nr:FAD-binding oxidoreductase [Rhodospirillaceae bacterium]MBT6135853.1 FAD-binding oxidoreductase [Rhodospirillaceae bacterium]